MVALLDVSVLVPLFDPDQQSHQLAHDWFEDQKASGWATCPLTENALIRILSGPKFFDPPHRPVDLVARLQAFRRKRSRRTATTVQCRPLSFDLFREESDVAGQSGW